MRSRGEQVVYQSGGGVSLMGLLMVVFITLKLTGYIAWSWWWVLAPLWMPLALLTTVALGTLAFFLIARGK